MANNRARSAKKTKATENDLIESTPYEQLQQNAENGEHTLVTGPTGSGKTFIVTQAAHKLGRPLHVLRCGGVLDAEAFAKGYFILVKGETVFVPSPLVDAIRTPNAIVLADEINRAPLSFLNALFSVLDFQKSLLLDLAPADERVVRCAQGVVFAATANQGPEFVGTHQIDIALRDRMTALRIEYPAHEHELLMQHGVDELTAHHLVKLAKAVRTQYANRSLADSISTRRLLYVARLVADGRSVEEAFLRNIHVYGPEIGALVATLRAAA